MTTIGKIELKERLKKLIIQWKIKDLYLLPEETNYSSCLFSFANETWCLSIYLNRPKNGHRYISLYLVKKPSSRSIKIHFSASLKRFVRTKVLQTHKAFVFGENECTEGFPKFISLSNLLESELVLSGTLTIICTLKYPESTEVTNAVGAENYYVETSSEDESDSDKEDNESKMKGLEILSENLKQLLFGGRMTDVILKTHGQEFHVHKIILIARSPVFASMFQHNLAEKNTNEVNITDCTAQSFEVFLHYLYSGSVETLSTSNVFSVYYAADKYQVDDLKEKCVSFMIENISVETFCDVIVFSLRHEESKLQKNAIDFFRKNIKLIIKTVQWQKYLDENSTQANELLIKAFNA